MMVRFQVSLPAEDKRRAQKRASELGISLAEYVRRLVERDLEGGGDRIDVSALFDLGRSGGSDVTRNKDRYVGEAIAARRGR